MRTYNTCAGYRYIRAAGGQSTRNWGLDGKAEGPFEDLDAFLHRADELAQSLLESGITGMKIWPFDPYAEASEGQYISAPDLERALEPFRKIRAVVGNRMDIMVEFHSLWRLLPAQRIAQALAEFDTFWHEDPIRMDSLRGSQAIRALLEGADLRLGDPRRQMEFQGSARDRCSGNRDVRPRLVRWHQRSAAHRRAR